MFKGCQRFRVCSRLPCASTPTMQIERLEVGAAGLYEVSKRGRLNSFNDGHAAGQREDSTGLYRQCFVV